MVFVVFGVEVGGAVYCDGKFVVDEFDDGCDALFAVDTGFFDAFYVEGEGAGEDSGYEGFDKLYVVFGFPDDGTLVGWVEIDLELLVVGDVAYDRVYILLG